ncbi:hypothetical protein BDZ97DRAFT_1842303 [Flammula alnicola]|nr:hypothetical protein BDZ97DRAFT_1842303 [Flammula alnicola]
MSPRVRESMLLLVITDDEGQYTIHYLPPCPPPCYHGELSRALVMRLLSRAALGRHCQPRRAGIQGRGKGPRGEAGEGERFRWEARECAAQGPSAKRDEREEESPEERGGNRATAIPAIPRGCGSAWRCQLPKRVQGSRDPGAAGKSFGISRWCWFVGIAAVPAPKRGQSLCR